MDKPNDIMLKVIPMFVSLTNISLSTENYHRIMSTVNRKTVKRGCGSIVCTICDDIHTNMTSINLLLVCRDHIIVSERYKKASIRSFPSALIRRHHCVWERRHITSQSPPPPIYRLLPVLKDSEDEMGGFRK